MLNKKLYAFTLAELLVTLALAAILVTLSYAGLGYIQKLLKQYNDQSFFITQIVELNKRLNYQTLLSREIKNETDKRILLNSDSGSVILEFHPNYILLKKNNQADSFLLQNSGLNLSYEKLNTGEMRLINKIEFDINFSKQIFHCTFNKNYDAYSKFMLESNYVND